MNNISFEALRGALILLPGFTWSLIWMKYSKNKPQTDKFYFVVYAIVASAFSYLIYYVFFFKNFDGNNLIKIFDDGINKNDLIVIFKATGISSLGALVSVILSHMTPIVKLMRFFNLTLIDGESDVLVSTAHAHMRFRKYSLIRLYDFNNNRIYQGLIVKVSEPKQQMEFIICDCDIYDNNTGKFLLTMKELYINLNSNNLLIEFIKYEKKS